MKIKSLQIHQMKMGTKEKELKFLLKPVKAGTISEKEVVNFCQSLTQLPRTYISASLESIIQAMAHYLSLGYSIKFDDLGTFSVTLDSKAVDNVAETGVSQLKNLFIRFRPSKDLIDNVRGTDIELEGIYKLVDEEKKIYEKVKKNSTSDSESTITPDDNGGGGGASSGGDFVG